MVRHVLLFAAVFAAFPLSASAELRAYDTGPMFAEIQAVDATNGDVSIPSELDGCTDGEDTNPNTLFSTDPMGFIGGITDVDGTLYAIDWDTGGGAPPIRLATITVNLGNGCAYGENVDPDQAINFTGLESLAYCADNQTLYSADFVGHNGKLVAIDKATGIGTGIGSGFDFDRQVVGMTCASDGELWAITNGFGGLEPELLTINRTTGVESLVGETGTANSSPGALVMEALAIDHGAPNFQLVGLGSGQWDIDPNTGIASEIMSLSNRAIWGATSVPEPSAGTLTAVALATLIWIGHWRSRTG